MIIEENSTCRIPVHAVRYLLEENYNTHVVRCMFLVENFSILVIRCISLGKLQYSCTCIYVHMLQKKYNPCGYRC